MHHHVAECDDRHILTVGDIFDRSAMDIVHRALMQHEPHPCAPGKGRVEPFNLHFQRLFFGWKCWHQNRETIGHAAQMGVVTIWP